MRRAASTIQMLVLLTSIAAAQPLQPPNLRVASTAHALPTPAIEIYVPQGMPVQIEVTRDERDLSITKLNIKRIVGPEVRSMSVTEWMMGPEYTSTTDPKPVTDGRISRYTTYNVGDPASAAWASSVDVRRFILLVERLETDTGVWVMGDGSKDRLATLAAIVERGVSAVPRATFIPK
ncbi:MAG: hypothetical protein AABO41_28410 [Acidobacteriota bacterium]